MDISHPKSGASANKYLVSDDGKVRVPSFIVGTIEIYDQVEKDMLEYKWNERDFLLATYPKNGTNFMWEIMMMLVRGSADYITDIKAACMIDLFPLSKTEVVFPSPRVLNTHYRLDVLPKEFRGRKTVLTLRNPKDTVVSHYYHDTDTKMFGGLPGMEEFSKITFSDYLRMYLFNEELPYGSYFDYVEYMWSLRDDPNLLIVYFEDLKIDPVSSIQKLNEFMGTQRSPELVQQIAEATSFKKMKEGKTANLQINEGMKEQLKDVVKSRNQEQLAKSMYRKGEIGDWKNHLTVAENEMFDEFLAKWQPSKEIPFRY